MLRIHLNKYQKIKEIHNEDDIIQKPDDSDTDLQYVVEEFDVSDSDNFDAKISKPDEDRLSDVLLSTITKRHSIANHNDRFDQNDLNNVNEEAKRQEMIQILLRDCKTNNTIKRNNKGIVSRVKTDSVFQNYMATENPKGLL